MNKILQCHDLTIPRTCFSGVDVNECSVVSAATGFFILPDYFFPSSYFSIDRVGVQSISFNMFAGRCTICWAVVCWGSVAARYPYSATKDSPEILNFNDDIYADPCKSVSLILGQKFV